MLVGHEEAEEGRHLVGLNHASFVDIKVGEGLVKVFVEICLLSLARKVHVSGKDLLGGESGARVVEEEVSSRDASSVIVAALLLDGILLVHRLEEDVTIELDVARNVARVLCFWLIGGFPGLIVSITVQLESCHRLGGTRGGNGFGGCCSKW